MAPRSSASPRSRFPLAAALAACLILAGALLAAPLRGHIDDTDAQLYQVLSRQMAAAHSWLEPGPRPGALEPFRDHLPFGLWPSVATVRLLGEGALPLPGFLFSLGTVALVFFLGARLLSLEAGVLAALVLACTETFFTHGARPRLDPPLLFLSLLAAAPALLGRLGGGGFALAAIAGALATLVKGPFGLLPLAAAGGARALLDWNFGGPPDQPADRSPALRGLLLTGLALTAAALPAALFLLEDRARGGSWFHGYLQAQVLASAAGLRRDGQTSVLYPFFNLAGRFWPGLPLALLGIAQATGVPLPAPLRASASARAPLRLVALVSGLMLLGLALPVRKVWNHELVVYPLLALLAGAAGERLLQRLPARAGRWTLGTLAVMACAFAALGGGSLVLGPPCVPSSELAASLAPLSPGTPVLLVSAEPNWPLLASLAAEQRLSPWPLPELPVAAANDQALLATERAHVALAFDLGKPGKPGKPPPAPWHIEASARGWVLLRR